MSRVLVCGLGQVGYRVATLLLDLGENLSVVTLDGREEWLRLLRDRGANVVIGDARDETILEQAGVTEATSIIACIHDDSTNIEITLDAHKLNPSVRTVARIVDPNLARQAEKHLGVHRAVAMVQAAAPTFAAAIYGDQILTEFNIGEERLLALKMVGPQELHEKPLVRIGRDDACDQTESKSLGEGETAVVVVKAESMAEQLPKRKRHYSLLKALAPHNVAKVIGGIWTNTSVQLRAMLIVILSLVTLSIIVFEVGMKLSPVDAVYFTVTTATTTGYGDISPKDAASWVKIYTCFMMVISAMGLAVLFSMVTDYILTSRLEQLVGRHHLPERGHVIVVGAGTVGHRVADELHRMKAHVIAIDRDEGGEYIGTLRAKIPVLIGDAREPATLNRAAVRHAKAIIATTASDAVNLSVGLAAKEINPDIRAVLSIFDVDFARRVGEIPEFDAALSPPMLAAPAFVGMALYADAVASFRLGPHFFTLCQAQGGTIHIAGKRFTLEERRISS